LKKAARALHSDALAAGGESAGAGGSRATKGCPTLRRITPISGIFS
jgi:hypothetical protein